MVAGLDLSAAIVAVVENSAEIGLVGIAGAQALERGFLVAERLKERIGELDRVELLFGKGGDGLFDLDCVHCAKLLILPPNDRGTSCALHVVYGWPREMSTWPPTALGQSRLRRG